MISSLNDVVSFSRFFLQHIKLRHFDARTVKVAPSTRMQRILYADSVGPLIRKGKHNDHKSFLRSNFLKCSGKKCIVME